MGQEEAGDLKVIVFQGDERFADLEYVGVQYDAGPCELVLSVSSDPADGCKTVVLCGVVAFDVVHFSCQNVVYYLDVARLSVGDAIGFREIAQQEGASASFAGGPIPVVGLLGLVFVAANGATIFALCQSVEKRLAGGQSVYRIAA